MGKNTQKGTLAEGGVMLPVGPPPSAELGRDRAPTVARWGRAGRGPAPPPAKKPVQSSQILNLGPVGGGAETQEAS